MDRINSACDCVDLVLRGDLRFAGPRADFRRIFAGDGVCGADAIVVGDAGLDAARSVVGRLGVTWVLFPAVS